MPPEEEEEWREVDEMTKGMISGAATATATVKDTTVKDIAEKAKQSTVKRVVIENCFCYSSSYGNC
jgi:hypothetical protein